jgi:hypothetical protein
MATTARTQRRYDHRFRDLVRTTRDIDCALQRGVPRSTARSWLTEANAEVVTVDVLDMNAVRLQQEVLRLRARVQKLTALLRVVLVVFRMSGLRAEPGETSGRQPQTTVAARHRALAFGSAAAIRAARDTIVAVAVLHLEPRRTMRSG